MNKLDDFLYNLYFSPDQVPSYRGARGILQKVKKKNKTKTLDWLRGQRAYTLHKPAPSKFRRRKIIVSGIEEQLQADLLDVSKFSKENEDVKFLLTAIDVFSKKAWVKPLKSKKGSEVAKALATILKNKHYRYLQTDKGKEFYNTDVTQKLKHFNIKLFSTENEVIKASIVERFNRTLRNRIYRYITKHDSNHFIDILPELVLSYNKTPHTSTGIAPDLVTRDNQEEIWFKLYEKDISLSDVIHKSSLKIGDFVRISKARGTFERGYTPNWSEEIFVINSIKSHIHPIVYTIHDLADERIDGTFYQKELQKVEKPKEYKIANILKRRTRKGKKEVFVQWLGYPDSFNSWVSEKDFV